MKIISKLVATNSIIEKTGENKKFKKQVDDSIMRFRKSDWGDVTLIDAESNVISIMRCHGLILGCYKTAEGYINVFKDRKQDKTIVCFANEYV